MPFLESPAFFGCQAGFSFLYVTAGGEVCPCDFVGESFGNAYREDLGAILARLRERFPRPTCRCLVPGREESAGGPADWDQMPAMIRALMPGDQATQ
jgi:MoaA/NifB/PqqE/SkfB family radical SAM enzyme